jgi:segregation and condensation protein B
MLMQDLDLHIEAIIFAARQAVSVADITKCLQKLLNKKAKLAKQEAIILQKRDVLAHIEALQQKYANGSYAYNLMAISGGYQLLTKSMYHEGIAIYLQQKNRKRLSKAAMETLAIIAYRQPVTKADIEQIRGVNCDYSVQKLLEKDLIAINGRSSAPGRPLLYGTSPFFMDYFGLQSVKDLPQLKEFADHENTIGSIADS